MSEKVLIIGGSSGIGLEMARQLAAAGSDVTVSGRNVAAMEKLQAEFPERIRHFVNDVTTEFDADALLEEAAADMGGLDVFVYSSGIMPVPEPGKFDTTKDLGVAHVNIEGAIKWVNAAATHLSQAKKGSIVILGSCAGDRAGKTILPAYSASKAFLLSFGEGLANRLLPYGVKVVIIKPGPTATPMTTGMKLAMMMPVETAAKKIIGFFHKPGVHYLNPLHRLIMWTFRNMPTWLMRKVPY